VVVTGSLYLVGEALELLGLGPAGGVSERGLNEWGGMKSQAEESEDRTKADYRGQTGVRPINHASGQADFVRFLLFPSCDRLAGRCGRARWLFELVRFVPGGDKAGHFILFGVLSFS